MSEFIIRKGFTNEVQRDTEIQKRNDQNIQKWLNCYKYYEEKEEFKQNTGKDFDLIISHRPTIPDLVIFNKPFNKNNCFCEANPDENNLFPRKKLFIKFDKKDKEQLKKYNLKMNKEYKFNSKKNNPNGMKIKENNNKKNKEIKENIEKEEKKKENKKENEENKVEEELEEEGEGEEDDGEDDEENEEKNDDEEEEKEIEKENDSKQDEKKEDLEGEEVKNFEEKKNNENNNSSNKKINDKINFSLPITSFFQKNNNNNISNNSNQNFRFINFDNCSTTSNTSKIKNNNNQSKMNLNNDNISNFDEISYDGSIYNFNNLVDDTSVSISQSQLGNESMNNISLKNINNVNNVNKNIGFNNNISNNLLQNLLNQSQINNNNQFSNFTNNMPFGFIGNNPLNIYNPSLNLQNNLNLHNSLLTQYTLKYWNVPGWLLTFIKEGNKIKNFTSFDLFCFLNQKIIENVKIDDYLITTENKEQKFTGGIVYISFINIFPNVFNILKEQSMKQISLNNLLLKSNNNFGIDNTNVLNNLNNNNFLMNNFNNNNFNFS